MNLDIFVDLLIVILGVGLAAWFAFRAYFRQREYELILSRYLEGGIDYLAGDLEGIAATFAHNWARCLAILKNYRDLEQNFDLHDLEKGYLPLQASTLHVAAHHRLLTLTGASEYWQVYQHATAFYTSANSQLVSEIPETIRVALTTDTISASAKEVAEAAFQVANGLNKDHLKYINLIQELQNLSTMLESERYTFKSIQKFSRKPLVAESVSRIKELLHSVETDQEGTSNRAE